jgi:ADP-heptose:LPS heptosyltransferase
VEHGRVPVFFLGPQERGLLADIRAAVPGARFPEWEGRSPAGPIFAIALAERLAAAVANDSGTGHMLAAGGVPLVSLFSKHDPVKYAPRARRLAIIDSKSFGGTDPALIPVNAVSRALSELLA